MFRKVTTHTQTRTLSNVACQSAERARGGRRSRLTSNKGNNSTPTTTTTATTTSIATDTQIGSYTEFGYYY